MFETVVCSRVSPPRNTGFPDLPPEGEVHVQDPRPPDESPPLVSVRVELGGGDEERSEDDLSELDLLSLDLLSLDRLSFDLLELSLLELSDDLLSPFA